MKLRHREDVRAVRAGGVRAVHKTHCLRGRDTRQMARTSASTKGAQRAKKKKTQVEKAHKTSQPTRRLVARSMATPAEEQYTNCKVRRPIEERCKPQCTTVWADYERCKERIKGAEGQKNCAPYYMDWLGCVDTCVRFLRPLPRPVLARSHASRCRSLPSSSPPSSDSSLLSSPQFCFYVHFHGPSVSVRAERPSYCCCTNGSSVRPTTLALTAFSHVLFRSLCL